MTPLTSEREKEIRDWASKPYDISPVLSELLAEIDRLRIWSSDSHVTDLEQEIDRLRAENEELKLCPNESWECAKEIRALTKERDELKDKLAVAERELEKRK